jgi:hypothetical protein
MSVVGPHGLSALASLVPIILSFQADPNRYMQLRASHFTNHTSLGGRFSSLQHHTGFTPPCRVVAPLIASLPPPETSGAPSADDAHQTSVWPARRLWRHLREGQSHMPRVALSLLHLTKYFISSSPSLLPLCGEHFIVCYWPHGIFQPPQSICVWVGQSSLLTE